MRQQPKEQGRRADAQGGVCELPLRGALASAPLTVKSAHQAPTRHNADTLACLLEPGVMVHARQRYTHDKHPFKSLRSLLGRYHFLCVVHLMAGEAVPSRVTPLGELVCQASPHTPAPRLALPRILPVQ